ncbi:MAG: fibronectin type III domain-containing protein, partial [Oscillospiraceae bacterium]|nr:fibronectin type III domain-containing protein [Oscillospiraceae bacterium]
ITKGWQTVAYRVRAYDEVSAYSGFAVSETREVNNNTPPRIVCDYPASTPLGLKNEGFEIPYTVEDEEGDAVTVIEAVDGAALRTFSVELGGTNSFQLTGEAYMRILNGTHTLTITASDGSASATHSLGFTKAVTEASVKLAQPMEADGPISVCVLSVSGFIPVDAEYSVEVTNNALDDDPVWEDCTAAVRAGVNHVFENDTAANGFAFDFRLKAKRGESGVGGYITSVQGGFQ